MPTDLRFSATEKSTMVVTCTFRDEDGALVIPSSATWTFTDKNGSPINNRSGVDISPLSSTVSILLSGNDLAIAETGGGVSYERRITIEATYNSTLGAGLPLKASAKFQVNNLAAIT